MRRAEIPQERHLQFAGCVQLEQSQPVLCEMLTKPLVCVVDFTMARVKLAVGVKPDTKKGALMATAAESANDEKCMFII